MLNPKCPSCQNELTIFHSFKMMNPWKCKCPSCGSVLEASWIPKTYLLLSAPIGILIAGVAIFQEERGNWEQNDSFIFFAIAFSMVLLVSVLLWSKSNYRLKQ